MNCPECSSRLIDQGYRQECPGCGRVWKRITETVGLRLIEGEEVGPGGEST